MVPEGEGFLLPPPEGSDDDISGSEEDGDMEGEGGWGRFCLHVKYIFMYGTIFLYMIYIVTLYMHICIDILYHRLYRL